jgi:hypothetical protein
MSAGIEVAGQAVGDLRVILPSGDVSVFPWSIFLRADLIANGEASSGVLTFASGAVRFSGREAVLEAVLEASARNYLRSIRLAHDGLTELSVEDPQT